MNIHDEQVIMRRSEMMSDRRYILNRKCFAALRAIGPGAESRWKYIHVSPKGVTCTDTVTLIRVTLPHSANEQGVDHAIYSYAQAKSLMPKSNSEIVMPEGMEAKTSGKYTVPNFDVGIPEPKNQTATVTVNAERLIQLLKAAIEVTEHSRNLVRLRFYKDSIRIDAHRDKGGQEFMGILMGTSYRGNCIPGDAPIETSSQLITEDADEKTLKLPVNSGRKFRD
jgi:hypothetical protein